ncbi:hypothetical protein CTEN210_09314 [Chaetoceros tenuissimus]|uniref:Cyclin N-terminal domain-containing protein n=1 Tax=Chaetoceros tenuissimus TaxID=426638 RepID=A0AAD3CVD0_9STRA|nr:hypothetical protein CTEN210_09314 [Chaetoceros tenuissimus]
MTTTILSTEHPNLSGNIDDSRLFSDFYEQSPPTIRLDFLTMDKEEKQIDDRSQDDQNYNQQAELTNNSFIEEEESHMSHSVIEKPKATSVDSDQIQETSEKECIESTTISPRTTSMTTLQTLGDEQFQFDNDSQGGTSNRTMPSYTGRDRAISSSSQSMSKMTIENSPKCTSFTPDNSSTDIDENNYQQHACISPYDPDLSMGDSSISTALTTRRSVDPPTSVIPEHSSNIQYVELPHSLRIKKNHSGGRKKVQPLVYSAIGSLESINQHSLGSFNIKMHLATKHSSKKEKKQENIDLYANTSHISNRLVQPLPPTSTADKIEEKKSSGLTPTLHHSNVTKRSNLSTTLASSKTDLVKEEQSSTNNPTLPRSNSTQEANKTIQSQDSKSKEEQVIPPIIKTQKRRKSLSKKKKVTIQSKPREIKRVELFRPSCDAYTPRMGRKTIKYKTAEQRMDMTEASGDALGTIQKPNFKDALRRVAMIIQQHIVKIEQRFASGGGHLKLFDPAMRDAFSEENFTTPRYKCTMVKLPMGRPGVVYGMRKIRFDYKVPTADEIYEFGHRLFNQVQLSSECSIIGLIYVERLMEIAKVPVLATTWKPIFMCGLLLASKVWQDWSSWNIEFANVYPQFSLEAINKLELQFLKMVKWDLYISSSLYAKYYFALRSLLEKQDFRRRYVRMVGGADHVSATQACKIAKRSEMLKEKSIACLSRSL